MFHSPSIVPEETDVYLVLDDFGNRLGRVWRETDEADTDRATLISYLLQGQYANPARVSDNGAGKPVGVFAQPKTGLGTGVAKALAKQLDAQAMTSSDASGTRVSVYSCEDGRLAGLSGL